MHEVAHLLPTTRREAAHGPGFAAIHLILLELVAPSLLPVMFQSYRAVGVPFDLSRVPLPRKGPGSAYVPLLESGLLDLSSLGVLLSSGGLSKRQRVLVSRLISQAGSRPVFRQGGLPDVVGVPTGALLACGSPEEVSRLVGAQLRGVVSPGWLRRPPKVKAKGKGNGR